MIGQGEREITCPFQVFFKPRHDETDTKGFGFIKDTNSSNDH